MKATEEEWVNSENYWGNWMIAECTVMWIWGWLITDLTWFACSLNSIFLATYYSTLSLNFELIQRRYCGKCKLPLLKLLKKYLSMLGIKTLVERAADGDVASWNWNTTHRHCIMLSQ